MYLFGDHVIWLHRNGLIKTEDIKKWEKFSNQSWLYSIILNLVRDYILWTSSKRANKALICDTMKNVADFFLPLFFLNKIQVSSGFAGLMGVISSVTAAIPLVDPTFRI